MTFFSIKIQSNLAKKIMNCFWPNFDVGKEQVRNTKRDNSQTDAESPYKIVMVTKHNVHLRHRREGNECRKRLETDASPQKHLGDFGRLHVWSSQGASFAESGLGDFLRVGFGFDVSRGRFSISVLVKSGPNNFWTPRSSNSSF